ncbi:GNAT family N-acetyltransferase [Flavobacterium sp.]|uniref:GNAT family N-acetyltransferase n=1 Tax=Flavobacterium sp. TaxID=239 RepID=UPI00375033A1
MIKINQISFKDTFPIRHAVLRAGKPIETCLFEGDDKETTTHFGLFVNKKITGVASVYKNKNNTFIVSNQLQIRGMAVLEEAQKLGYGKLLILECERLAKTQNANLIWFNAREKAITFYEKLAYKKHGNSFLIADVGIHFLMTKELS